MAQSKWQKAHPEAVAAATARWLERNPGYRKAYKAKWYAKNRERAIEYAKAYYRERHPDWGKKDSLETRKARRRLTKRMWHIANLEKGRAYKKLYRKKYSSKVCADTVMRKAAKRKSVPKWANRFFIEEAYSLAKLRTKMLGFKWHVDHIVPMKGLDPTTKEHIVCGLHWEKNLQVIPAIQNLKKWSTSWPDMP